MAEVCDVPCLAQGLFDRFKVPVIPPVGKWGPDACSEVSSAIAQECEAWVLYFPKQSVRHLVRQPGEVSWSHYKPDKAS